MHDIKHKELIKSGSFINGNWLTTEKPSEQFKVINPATQVCLNSIHNAQKNDAETAVEAAASAFPSWTKLTAYERAEHLTAWAKLITEHEQDLARLLTLEQGKPVSEALAEIRYGVSYLHWFSEEGKRSYGDVIPALSNQQKILVNKQAVGVVTSITPWNFPNAMLLRKASVALAAGCTFVIKPAADTPLSALALAHLANVAGLPDGIFNVVVSTESAEVGKVLTMHPKVNKFSFTGSTGVGKTLLAQCAEGVKKVSMELGGNAPLIVFESADIDAAVNGLISNKFKNAGQICVAINRVFVHSNIANEFTEKVIKATQLIKAGNGLDSKTNIGPLITQQAVDKVSSLVSSAVEQGAEIAYQSELTLSNKDEAHDSLKADGFYPATVLTNVNNEMDIAQTEIFGPVISIMTFEDETEVVEQANATDAGLASYFYSQNMNQVWRVSDALQYGMVGINETALSNAAAPFGGIKESGSGREGSKYGLDDYLEIKYLCLGGIEQKS